MIFPELEQICPLLLPPFRGVLTRFLCSVCYFVACLGVLEVSPPFLQGHFTPENIAWSDRRRMCAVVSLFLVYFVLVQCSCNYPWFVSN